MVGGVDLHGEARAWASGSRSPWRRRRARRRGTARRRRRRPSAACRRSTARCSRSCSGRCRRRCRSGRGFPGPCRTGCSRGRPSGRAGPAAGPGADDVRRHAGAAVRAAAGERYERDRDEGAPTSASDATQRAGWRMRQGRRRARWAGQRAQHARDLAGGLARAGGLDREHLLEVGGHARRRRGSARRGPWRPRGRATAAVAAETSGRSSCTSGTSSRTWLIATATGDSPRKGPRR